MNSYRLILVNDNDVVQADWTITSESSASEVEQKVYDALLDIRELETIE